MIFHHQKAKVFKISYFYYISYNLENSCQTPKNWYQRAKQIRFFYNTLPFPISFQHIVHILLFNNYWMVCIPTFLMPFFLGFKITYYTFIWLFSWINSSPLFHLKEASYDHGTLDLIWEISLGLPMMSRDLLFNILFYYFLQVFRLFRVLKMRERWKLDSTSMLCSGAHGHLIHIC
jgi:hypothetical protein